MEKDCYVNVLNPEHKLTQADKKIAALQTLCDRRGQQEQAYRNEILFYHKKTASLEQDVCAANRKVERLQVMNQEAEKLNKKRRDDYFEACKIISTLEAKNLSLVNREAYVEKQVQSMNQSVSQMEKENLAALRKVSELEQNQEFLDRKRREAVGQVHKLQTKNAELEASLEFYNHRNRYSRRGNGKNNRDGTRSSLSEIESMEMECDFETSVGGSEMERKFEVLKREKEVIFERLQNAENDILEGERMNTALRQQVVELKKTLNERDNQVRQCKQLYETSRRDSQEEIYKLEETVHHWQSKYDLCLIGLEKESNNRGENRDIGVEEGHEACWECEMRLRACHSEVAERDITIVYLQKINESHEDKIRQILNKYKKSNKNEDSSKKDVTSRDFPSIPDLHHELNILLAFYKKRSENAILELNKWKALAVEGRLCRERETSLFESQLSGISKDYCEKYEKSRSLLEEEKNRRFALEGQIQILVGKLKELEKCESKYLQYEQESPHFRHLHDSLAKNNDVYNSKHGSIVTQCYEQIACQQEFDMADSLDDHEAPMEATMGENSKDVTEPEIPLKHENTNIERDSQLENVSPMIDAEKETVVENAIERPVDSNRLMESTTNAVMNGSNGAINQEGSVDKEVPNENGENQRKKNTGLQALWENLTKERDTAEQTTKVSDQQSSEMAANCEAHENEIHKLRQEIQEAAEKYKALEKTYSDCKAENQRLEELVLKLGARITELESEQGVKESFPMASEKKTQSAEVVEAQKDDLQEIEEALNEGFAAQEDKSTSGMPADKPTNEPAVVGEEKIGKQEPSGSPAGKLPGHGGSSLPRKFPSTSTAPMPFKLHTPSSSSHSTASSRQRTRSVDHTTGERRESVGSDMSGESVPSDAGNDNKPRFLQKKFSSSRLDAFKPKPFKKQTSLSDDNYLYSRQRKNSGSKSESVGSASDSDPTQEITAQAENVEITQQATDSADSSAPVAKEPPHTLPKPQKSGEKPAEKSSEKPDEKPSFQKGFSMKDYYSSIRPKEHEQTTPHTDSTLENQDDPKEIVKTSEGQTVDKGDLV